MLASLFDRPVMVTRYPSKMKAFYMQPDPEDPELALALDVLAPEGYGEIIGGSQRIHDHDLLLQRIQEHELPVEAFQWYLDVRKYGAFPHSGFGMGIERFVAWMCGVPHLRETIPYPRMLYQDLPVAWVNGGADPSCLRSSEPPAHPSVPSSSSRRLLAFAVPLPPEGRSIGSPPPPLDPLPTLKGGRGRPRPPAAGGRKHARPSTSSCRPELVEGPGRGMVRSPAQVPRRARDDKQGSHLVDEHAIDGAPSPGGRESLPYTRSGPPSQPTPKVIHFFSPTTKPEGGYGNDRGGGGAASGAIPRRSRSAAEEWSAPLPTDSSPKRLPDAL